MTDNFSWVDVDGDQFEIEWDTAEEDPSVIASIGTTSGYDLRYVGVFVREDDARALIDWLQRRLEQVSSTPEGIPHTDAPVKDDTK